MAAKPARPPNVEAEAAPKSRRPNRKRDYRRDKVLLKLCDIQMKFMIKEAMNETNDE